MLKPCLKDKNEFPCDEVLKRYLGEVKTTWDGFIHFINKNYPSFSAEWRYYNDGKRYGKIRGLTIDIREPSDLDATKILIEIKEKIK